MKRTATASPVNSESALDRDARALQISRRRPGARLSVPRSRPHLLPRHLGHAVLRARNAGGARTAAAAALSPPVSCSTRAPPAGWWGLWYEGLRRAAGRPRPPGASRSAPPGPGLCPRISASLVPQRGAPRRPRPGVRSAVGNVLRRLARAADARFRGGVSAGRRLPSPGRRRAVLPDFLGIVVVPTRGAAMSVPTPRRHHRRRPRRPGRRRPRRSRGLTPLVLEAGRRVGAGVRRWGHVRMFSPWKFSSTARQARLHAAAGRMPRPTPFRPAAIWSSGTSSRSRRARRSRRTSACSARDGGGPVSTIA